MDWYNKIRKFFAWLIILVIIGIVLMTFITGITGSRFFWMFVYLMFVVPVLLWVLIRIFKVIFNHETDSPETMEEHSLKKEEE